MTERTKFNAAVSFIIQKDDKILLFYRTDGYFKGGWWVLPAGHIEAGETASAAVVRECKEELGIEVALKDVEFAHVMHNLSGENQRIDFYFRVKRHKGEIRNLESEKCAKMDFFTLNELPPQDKIAPSTWLALQNILNNIPYSERDK
ncbi:MAG: NUDIX domain-containing protein [Alphaproteobacteria bacterium]|nr:NUDIX domain-containing protein [Alphaproteobacteria bacterium]